jgi:hypothetical protein
MFYGEGDEHEAVQRCRAICESKGLDELPELLTLCCYPPNLGDGSTLAEIEEYLQAVRPVLVVVDPLYLSQGGASGRNLGEMGAFLREVQTVCKDAGAALMATAHWNKTGDGGGFGRITGTGLRHARTQAPDLVRRPARPGQPGALQGGRLRDGRQAHQRQASEQEAREPARVLCTLGYLCDV